MKMIILWKTPKKESKEGTNKGDSEEADKEGDAALRRECALLPSVTGRKDELSF